MEITVLKIKNFLSLSDVEIHPGKINQIVGGNNQGKTSILKALTFAVQGSNDPSLVKFGEDQAEVLVELSDNTSIRRRLNSDGKQTIDVKRDGMKAQAPQSFLDALFDQSSFNPLDLLNPKNRTEAILKSIDIKVTPQEVAEQLDMKVEDLPVVNWNDHGLKVVDVIYRYMYQRRAEANKATIEKKKRWETYKRDLPQIPEMPLFDREVIRKNRVALLETNSKINSEMTLINAKAQQIRQRQSKVAEFQLAVEKSSDVINDLEIKLSAARARHESAMEFYTKAKLDAEEEIPTADHWQKELLDNAQLLSDLNSMEKDWDKIDMVKNQYRQVNDLEKEMSEAQMFSDCLNEKVNILYGPLKKKLMDSAEMPVKGLSYNNGDFYIDETRVDNLSSSLAIRLAVAVARKLAKKTKIICIDGAEQLDENTFETFVKETEGDGFTYFVTKVGEPFQTAADKSVTMRAGQVLQ